MKRNKNRITERTSLVVKKHQRKKNRSIVLAIKFAFRLVYQISYYMDVIEWLKWYSESLTFNYTGTRYLGNGRIAILPNAVNDQKLLTYTPVEL